MSPKRRSGGERARNIVVNDNEIEEKRVTVLETAQ